MRIHNMLLLPPTQSTLMNKNEQPNSRERQDYERSAKGTQQDSVPHVLGRRVPRLFPHSFRRSFLPKFLSHDLASLIHSRSFVSGAIHHSGKMNVSSRLLTAERVAALLTYTVVCAGKATDTFSENPLIGDLMPVNSARGDNCA